MTVKNKVALLSVEGLPLTLFRRVIESAKFEHIQSLFDNAHLFDLVASWPNAAAAWTTVATGQSPGRHPIFSDHKRAPGTYQFVIPNARFRQASPVWEIIKDYGCQVGVFNLPVSYPPEPVKGFCIAGSDLPSIDSPFTYPNGLYALLENEVGPYQVDVDYTLTEKSAYLEDIGRLASYQFEVFGTLLQKFSGLDLILANFTALDRLLHVIEEENLFDDPPDSQTSPEFLTAQKIAYNFFEQLDDVFGQLLTSEANFTPILMAPYGQQKINHRLDLNQWLVEAGLLKLKADSAQQAPSIDWLQTKAYSLGSYGHIYLNRQGREPNGVVEEGQMAKAMRQKIRATLMNRLNASRYTGEAKIFQADDIYSGPYFNAAPDLVLDLPAGYHITNQLPSLEPVAAWGLEGVSPQIKPVYQHSKQGFFILNAKLSLATETRASFFLEDVAPTILTLLGIPAPASMEGRSLIAGQPEESFLQRGEAATTETAKPTNIETLHQLIDSLEAELQLKQTELRVQEHTLAPLRTEVEHLRQLSANLQGEVDAIKSGRVMKLLLAQTHFFNTVKRKLIQ